MGKRELMYPKFDKDGKRILTSGSFLKADNLSRCKMAQNLISGKAIYKSIVFSNKRSNFE